ncbi:MAG: hypothetical protein AABY84_07390 [Candidatus Firestonebacteria bacterium]
MKCPGCGFEQEDKTLECQRCQLIFSKWEERQVKKQLAEDVKSISSTTSITSTTESEPTKKPKPLLGIIVLLLLVGFGVWVFVKWKGLPIPEGAYRDDKNNFAISCPSSGWIIMNSENFTSMIQQYKDQIPQNLMNLISQSKAAVHLIKISESMQGGQINVVVSKSGTPKFNEKNKDEVVKYITSSFTLESGGVFQDYNVDSSEIIEVDKLKSLKIIANAKMQFTISQPIYTTNSWGMTTFTPGSYETYELKFIQTIVPGVDKFYVITCMSDQNLFNDLNTVFNDTVNSFRVTKRSVPFFGWVFGGKIFGIPTIYVMIMFGILSTFFRWVFNH